MPPQPAPSAPPTVEVRTPAPAPDLTMNKVIAGAGAAATAAVLGSYLGAGGTVAGAAIGSVASTVATTLYQRSLDRTRDTVVARIRPAIPGQRSASPDADTVVLAPVPAPRRPWRRALVAAVVVFVLGLAAVTGLEWVKGSTLTTDEAGTSVGRVVAPSTDTGASPDGTAGDGTSPDGTDAPGDAGPGTSEPDATDPGSDDATSPPDATGDTDPEGSTETVDPTPVPEPGLPLPSLTQP